MRKKFFLIANLSFFLALQPIRAQQFRLDPSEDGKGDSGFSLQWDASQDRPLAFRDISVPSPPAARLFNKAGGSIPVFPLQDISGAAYIDVWAGAATPINGLVLAGVIGYGPRGSKPAIKSVILTYDEKGALTKFWDVEPYHHHNIAVDQSGNVYALGDRTDGENSYPLLTKYSSEGKIIRQFMSSDLFQTGDGVLDAGSPYGQNQMLIKGNELIVWLASTRELLRFSTDGLLIARTSLVPGMQQIELANAGARLQILFLSVGANHEVVAQGRLWPQDTKLPTSMIMLRIQPDGKVGTFTPTAKGQIERLFAGTTKDNSLIFREASGAVVIFKIE